MTARKNIEDKLEELGQAIGSDESLVENVMSRIDAKPIAESNKTGKSKNKLLFRRFVMNRFTKFAAAAAIIIAVVLSITFLDKSVTPAYAIKQTVEAVKNVRFLHIIMQDDDERIVDERWIEVGADGFQARYRQESNFMGMSLLIVDDGETCFFYDRNKNTAVLYDRNEKQYQWIGNLGQFFEDMAGDSTVTIEENVDYKGQRSHRVRWLKLNQDCYIDPGTKLPIAVGPHDVFYKEPPQGTFEYAIPDGVTIVDKRPGAPTEQDPEWMKQDEFANKQFKRAREALAEGRYTNAIELFGNVVKVQAMRNWAWFWLGQAHYQLDQHQAAITAFTQVIDMSGKFKLVPHYCHLARGYAYQAIGMEEAAWKDFSAALPVMIDVLRNPQGAKMFDYADDLLEKGKGLSERERLNRMIERLREVTGQNFGYDPNASAEEKEQAIAAWEQWYETSSRIEFTPGADLVPVSPGVEQPGK